MISNSPMVAHFIRAYLSKTETFVGNQINNLHRFRSSVYCHHLRQAHSYPIDGVISVSDLLSQGEIWFDNLLYKGLRTLSPSAAFRFAQKVTESDTALLHFHYLVDARFFLEVKRKTGLPSVVSVYGYDVSSFPRMFGGYGRYYLRPLFDEIDLFLAMSQDMRQDLINLGCPAEKIIVHYHGIDTHRFLFPTRDYTDKEMVNILVLGTLEIKKAQHLVLEALHLGEQRKIISRPFHITFVGDGSMRNKLEAQVADYRWKDRVTFKGFISHKEQTLVEVFRNADIFSLPSITIEGDKEGIPGTIVEAMASGLPTVSTYHAGIPEIITTGNEGILVNEGDVPAMAQAFADLIGNPKLRELLGRAASQRAVSELDLHPKTHELEDIYSSLVQKKDLI